MLVPSKAPHPFVTKRPVPFRNFYQVCDQDKVSIVDVNKTPVTKMLPSSIVTADGAIHEIVALVLATGFDAITCGLRAINIINRAGGTPPEKWRELVSGMTADTPFPITKSYYMGDYIDGKPREALNLPDGIPLYCELLDEAAEKGYDAYVLIRLFR
ncbi:Cyclopentanone 1,2-monooxygenase [Fusarium agapanthi]|uniref:Cyclopentanone 1,2-monooxygenase n=1 Tax=Fusarium agapanthi TaxID=1803897 RepID=A0A9P5B2L4_9HYPO|nr:Cyclopentanone 1,2-monooxygenase [Fusarium agapanthi]